MMTAIRMLWCVIFHQLFFGDDTWEVVRLPTNGLVERPALWRVWRHCRKCGRGWTKMVEQVGYEVTEVKADDPSPMILDTRNY